MAAAGIGPVSRETTQRLDRFVELLGDWQRVQNLVGPGALDEIWMRHIADSAQLLALAPAARQWLDIGSGAGFPGMVLAALLAESEGATVHLIESNGRKCAFLAEAARVMGAPAIVHNVRIEVILQQWAEPIDAISARALAPLRQLAVWLRPILAKGVPAYLHKGLDFAKELAAMPDRTDFVLVEHPSRIGSGVIVELRLARGDARSEN